MNTAVVSAKRNIAIDELDQAIVNLSATINAATYELLVMIRQFDERAGWLRWGFANCTQWLHWRCDLSLSAAREKIRVAHALKNLPAISAAFSKGVLSYSKVRALTRVANTLNEPSLLDFAMTTTAARVEERCRQLRNVQPVSVAEGNRVYQSRSLQMWRNTERGTMTLTVELPLEEGDLIDQALSKAVESNRRDGPEFESESWSAHQADALVDVARQYLALESESTAAGTDAYQVVIHVDQSALTDDEGRSDLPVEAVRRLSCDGNIISMVDNADGQPLRVGRKQRTVTTAIRRALWARDKGCSFPGCGNTRFVDAHHVQHWAHGGETSVENLLLLCTRHHRLVHEGGFSICDDHQGEWYFKRPDGRAVPAQGYSPDDMTDDDVCVGGFFDRRGAFAESYVEADDASAEGFGHQSDASTEGFRRQSDASAEGFRNQPDASAEEFRNQANASAEEFRDQANGSAEEFRNQANGSAEEFRNQADASAEGLVILPSTHKTDCVREPRHAYGRL